MSLKTRKKLIKDLDKELAEIRKSIQFLRQTNGWIKKLSAAYQLNYKNLSTILNVSPRTVKKMEMQELSEEISIQNLRKIADALNSDLYYFVVPRKSIEETIHAFAQKYGSNVADLIARFHSFEPESEKAKKNKEEIIEELTFCPGKSFWEYVLLIEKELS